MWTEHDHIFKELFRGHPDAYGGENGVCIKQPPKQEVWESHLYGERPIGIYCMMPGNSVLWACTDIDVDDFPMAVNLARTLRHMGFNPYIETSRQKGYHVWVFFKEQVSAQWARNMMLVAHKVSGVPVKEVNPKQYELTEKKPYGNYVRLPYPCVARDTPRRKVLQGESFKPYPYERFVWDAWDTTADPSLVQKWAGHYVPEPNPAPYIAKSTLDAARMSPLTFHVFQKGPGEQYDRSSTLVRLARLIAADGYGPDECKSFLVDADRRWGKYAGRSDVDDRLDEIVRKFYG